MKKNKNLTLFTSTFYISAFTFGGGYVIIPLMKERFVDELKWIDEKEMLDMISLAQSAPGAVAINASILVGYKVNGVKGSLTTILATIMPPIIIISIISLFYQAFISNLYIALFLKGMQAAVCAVIFNVVFDLVKFIYKDKDVFNYLLMFAAIIFKLVFKFNVIYIIAGCAFVGLLRGLYQHYLKEEK